MVGASGRPAAAASASLMARPSVMNGGRLRHRPQSRAAPATAVANPPVAAATATTKMAPSGARPRHAPAAQLAPATVAARLRALLTLCIATGIVTSILRTETASARELSGK